MKYDFSIQKEENLLKNEDYVKITCGKGKKDDSKIHIKAIEFTYLEGLIWDKYREYGSKPKTKISTPDWTRILGGFKECIELLTNYVETDSIKDILQFNLYRAKFPLVDIKGNLLEIKGLVNEVAVWLEANVKDEKHITIIKSKS